MTNNPFDLDNYVPQISMKDRDTARKTSYQQTSVINRKRAQGIEPSINYSPNGMDTQPKKFVADMPLMPKFDKNAAARRQRKEAKKPKSGGNA